MHPQTHGFHNRWAELLLQLQLNELNCGNANGLNADHAELT